LFKTKKGSQTSTDPCYANEKSYSITSDLTHYSEWRDEEIIDRAQKWMKKILEILDINNLDIPKGFDYNTTDSNGNKRAADWYDRLEKF